MRLLAVIGFYSLIVSCDPVGHGCWFLLPHNDQKSTVRTRRVKTTKDASEAPSKESRSFPPVINRSFPERQLKVTLCGEYYEQVCDFLKAFSG